MVAGVSALPGNGQRPQAKAAGKLKDSSLTSRTDSRTRGAPPGATGGFPETWPPGSLGCVFPLPQQPGAPPHLQPLLQPPPPPRHGYLASYRDSIFLPPGVLTLQLTALLPASGWKGGGVPALPVVTLPLLRGLALVTLPYLPTPGACYGSCQL